MLVYSVASKQSLEMVRVLSDKILNHLVPSTSLCMFYLLFTRRLSDATGCCLGANDDRGQQE